MQVVMPSEQHAVMIEAVENHMPEVIVIDEIGTELEASAARTIAERGVQLVGTAHGNTLENLMMNPTLCDLIGGIQTVTLSDEEARRRCLKLAPSDQQLGGIALNSWVRLAPFPRRLGTSNVASSSSEPQGNPEAIERADSTCRIC